MATNRDAAQRTLDTIRNNTRDVLANMARRIEAYKAEGRDDVAAELAAEARRYAESRRRDYVVAVQDWFDADLLDAGIPMDQIVRSEIIYDNIR